VQGFFEQMVERLAGGRVEYVVVGMMSGVLQGASLVTRDLDICYRRTPENLARLASALRDLKPHPRGFPANAPFVFDERTLRIGCNFTLAIGDEHLDLLGEMSAIGGYDDIVGDAITVEIAGLQVRLLSLRHLIASKRAAARPKDPAALPVLEALLEMQGPR